MARAETVARWSVGAVVALAAVLALLLLTVPRSDWAHRQARSVLLDALDDRVRGTVRVGAVSGNLLHDATLEDVVVEDSAGARVGAIDRVTVRYSAASLLRERIRIRELVLDGPTVLLDRPPGGEWNVTRLLVEDTAAVPEEEPAGEGFGSWVRIGALEVRDGRVTVRSPWEPPDEVEEAALDSVVAEALSDRSRTRVEPVPGGYQVVREARELDLRAADLVVADPEEPVSGEIASVSATVLPFRPPALEIRDLEGRFAVTDDSVRVSDVRLELPDSELRAEGSMALGAAGATARVDVERLSADDLAWLEPELPRDARASLVLELERSDEEARFAASEIDLRVEEARLEGYAEATVADSVRPGAADLAFRDVDTRLLEGLAPGLELPVDGVAGGRLALAPDGPGPARQVEGEVAFRDRTSGTRSRIGARGGLVVDGGVRLRKLRLRFEPLHLTALAGVRPELASAGSVTGSATLEGEVDGALHVRSELAHRSPAGARSRLRADGGVALGEGPSARDFTLRLDPLRVAALEPFSGSLPVGGDLHGRVTVDGAPASGVTAALDLEHRDSTGVTRIAGEGRLGPERGGESRRFAVDLNVPALALGTAGAFAPAAGLRGAGHAEVTARGPVSELALDVDLGVEGGGGLRATGTLDLEGPEPGYDLLLAFEDLNAAAASTRAPATALRGTVALTGVGSDPATLEAEVRADLEDAVADSLGPGAVRLAASMSDGLARVEEAVLRLASARASLEGAFGLTAERRGELDYRVAVDSLSQFERFLPPPDTAAAEEAAAEASTAAAAETDTAAAAAAESLAGAVRLDGTIAGNPDRLDVRGRTELRTVAAAGFRVADGWLEFDAADLRSDHRSATGTFRLSAVRTPALAFDSVSGTVVHREAPDRGEGTAELRLVQDAERDYGVRAGYTLELDERELRLEEAGLRFDTVRWSSTGPAAVRWGGSGIAVEGLELTSDGGGRIFADGRFVAEPEDGAPAGAEPLVVEVEDLEVDQVMGLLQRDTLEASGRLNLSVTASGPPSEARIDATLSLEEPFQGRIPLPEVEARLSYVPGSLEGSARLLRHDTLRTRDPLTLVRAEGRAAVDLFENEAAASRELEVDVRADSLPLEGLFGFTDAVSDVRGRIRADVGLTGTLDDVTADGFVELDLGRLDVVDPGLQLRDIVGTLRFLGDSVALDSLRLRSRGGPVRVAGGVDLSDAGQPRLDLSLTANDAQVLNDHRYGRQVRADADLALQGPWDSLSVDGEVRVLEGTLLVAEARDDVLDLGEPLAQRAIEAIPVEPEAVPGASAVLAGLRADVELTIARNTWVRSQEGTVEIYTPEDGSPLQIRYDAGAGGLVIDGMLHADRGEYTFAGRRFEVTTGTATFLAQATVDPLLHLTATHEVERPGREALTIQINVVGRLFEPRVVLTSDAEPPLSQSDLISYLVFGTSSASLLQGGGSGLTGGSGRELGALATQQLASLAVSSLVDEAFSNLETSAAATGVDVLRIEPADLPDELAFDGYFQNLLRGTQIEAGEYVTRRLFLGVRGRPTTETWPGLRAEYRMPGGFRWTASWEPGYLPSAPAFPPEGGATGTRILSTFFFWESRAGLRSEAPTEGPGN